MLARPDLGSCSGIEHGACAAPDIRGSLWDEGLFESAGAEVLEEDSVASEIVREPRATNDGICAKQALPGDTRTAAMGRDMTTTLKMAHPGSGPWRRNSEDAWMSAIRR